MALAALLAGFDRGGLLFTYETVPEGDLDQWCGATGKATATGIPFKERNHSEDDVKRELLRCGTVTDVTRTRTSLSEWFKQAHRDRDMLER